MSRDKSILVTRQSTAVESSGGGVALGSVAWTGTASLASLFWVRSEIHIPVQAATLAFSDLFLLPKP